MREIPENTPRLLLCYPRGGPWGGSPPSHQPIHLWRLLFRLDSVAHAPFVVSIVHLFCGIPQANLFLTVPRILLLLHFPRFPFHDSTGFENPCISIGKPYILRVYRGSFSFGSTGALREAARPPESFPRYSKILVFP